MMTSALFVQCQETIHKIIRKQ